MILLTSTTDKLQLVTGSAGAIDVHADWLDNTPPSSTAPGRANTAIATAATTDVVPSPPSGKQRNLKSLWVSNRGAAANDITVQHADGAVVVQLYKLTLEPAATLQYIDEHGFLLAASVAPPSAGFTTGDAKLTLKTVADAGWVIMDDGTIGNDLSGATRANRDTKNLFTLLFNNINDANAPIFTSAGAATTRAAQTDAVSAWAAHCRMSLTKQLGRALAIGGTGAGLTARALGQTLGEEQHYQTLAELVPHVHAARTYYSYVWAWGAATITYGNVEQFVDTFVTSPSISVYNGVNVDVAGGGAPFNVMQPTAFWNVMIKL